MFKSFFCVAIIGLASAIPSASAKLLQRSTSIDNVIERAHQLLGTPYKAGGASTERGFDCSSFLVYLFKTEADIQLPRTSTDMHRSTAVTIKREALKPGDAVFFSGNGSDRVSHVGLYIGQDKFIHSPSSGKRVRIDSLSHSYWKRNYTTAKRFHSAG